MACHCQWQFSFNAGDLALCLVQRRSTRGKGYVAVPACKGSLAGAKRACNQTSPIQTLKAILARSSVTAFQACRHELGYPRAPAWFMKSLRLGALLGRQEKRKVYAGNRPRALSKGPLTSKLARASPKVPQSYTSYS
eukprot:1137426-Pelagomonas_calceolata.AAC.4